ncbi:hypothetical protein EAF00_008000 [Botryotinia globosa]|nr:hypothetical protein EAF00_008000 [Botryotinia globosa]
MRHYGSAQHCEMQNDFLRGGNVIVSNYGSGRARRENGLATQHEENHSLARKESSKARAVYNVTLAHMYHAASLQGGDSTYE